MFDFKGRTYLELDHKEPMTVDEINTLYNGYWVYVVNAEFYNGLKLKKGIPVIIANNPFEGVDDGIYEKYDSPKYGEHFEHILYKPNGFISALEFVKVG